MKKDTIINWGAYDIDNLGDLLFPYIVEYFLKDYNLNVIHVSPTGRKSNWHDAKSTLRISDAIEYDNIIGLIIGGGNLISWTKSLTSPYGNSSILSNIVHPSFLYVPYILNYKYSIPFAFNTIGVSKPIPDDKKNETSRIIEKAAFISCRDNESVERLHNAGIKSSIHTSIDSVFYINSVFPKDNLIKHFNESAVKKYRIPTNRKLAVLYLKKRYFENQYEEIQLIIQLLKSRNIHPIFMPLGLCFKDELLLENSIFETNDITIIKKPDSILDILAILAKADFYIGSSLHGAIVSLTYGNRIGVVANEEKSQIRKISGFLKHTNMHNSLFPTWKDLLIKLNLNGFNLIKAIDPKLADSLYDKKHEIFKKIIYEITNVEIKQKKENAIINSEIEDSIAEFYKI